MNSIFGFHNIRKVALSYYETLSLMFLLDTTKAAKKNSKIQNITAFIIETAVILLDITRRNI